MRDQSDNALRTRSGHVKRRSQREAWLGVRERSALSCTDPVPERAAERLPAAGDGRETRATQARQTGGGSKVYGRGSRNRVGCQRKIFLLRRLDTGSHLFCEGVANLCRLLKTLSLYR